MIARVATLAIVNPAAGRRSGARIWSDLVAHLESIRAWQCVATEYRGHARELAQRAATDGVERVVAIGGDGTISEVAGGLAHSHTALGIIPVGTGNDSARSLGIPRDPLAAARLAQTGNPRAIDLGEIATLQAAAYFVSVAGFGFDAAVASRVNRMPRLTGGTLPYVAGVLLTLWLYRAAHVRLKLDGRRVERALFLGAVANHARYGGGMQIVPHARADDGLLDLCLVRDLSRLEVLRLMPKLYSGGHVGNRAVELFSFRELTAEADTPVQAHADGELIGELPIRVSVRPGALWCVTGTGQTTASR
jgi:diacylglycerol kinase (ATP)